MQLGETADWNLALRQRQVAAEKISSRRGEGCRLKIRAPQELPCVLDCVTHAALHVRHALSLEPVVREYLERSHRCGRDRGADLGQPGRRRDRLTDVVLTQDHRVVLQESAAEEHGAGGEGVRQHGADNRSRLPFRF